MLLDDVLPTWDVRTRRSRDLVAPPGRVWRAVHETTLDGMRAARLLFRLRGLPVRPDGRLLDLEGFELIAEDPGRELVVGGVGKPWTPRGGLRREVDVRMFDEPGYARMALNVAYDGRVLSTETRVHVTDASSRRLFRVYWLVVGPFSRVVRDEWLRAIARRARAA